MRRIAFAFFVLASGCSDSSSTDQQDGDDDYSVDRRVFEGQQIVDLLGEDAVSDPIVTTEGFRRLGVMWDASAEGALEVRTSLDGLAWSPWTAPQLVSVEEIAHAGHIDAIAGATETVSLDSDPHALWYQLRVPAGVPMPTFLVVEPIVEMPQEVELETKIPEIEPELDTIESGIRSTPIGDLRIFSRADWGARKPRCASGTQTPTRATIHHTVTPTVDSMTVPQRLRQIQSFHMFTRGWCDIGYNFLVSRDGRVWRGRGARIVGAHVEGHNTGNVGISFIGTYTSTAPTQTQMCQSAKLLRRLHMDWPVSLNRTDVKGHRQLGSTSCPGDALYNRIDAILNKARNGCN